MNGRLALAVRSGNPALDERRLEELVAYSAGLRVPMLAAAAFIAVMAWLGGQPDGVVMAWLAAVVGMREWRAARLLRLRDDRSRCIEQRLISAFWLTLWLGLAYGSAALFMPGLDIEYDAILTMMLLSLGAGAITTTFTVIPAFLAFGAGVTVPAAIAWGVGGQGPVVVLAPLLLAVLHTQTRFARRTYGMFEESWHMGRRNDELLAQLSAEQAALRQARDSAVAADMAKSRFLASASHDLRQPLQSLVLNSGAMSRRPLDPVSDAIAGDIAVSIDALGHLLDGLLDISRLDAGVVHAELQALRLSRLVGGLVRRFEGAALEKQLQLQWSCPETLSVISDAQMLQRIVSNLLDNAIKFTAQGTVRVDCVDLGSRVRMTISDTGVGIAASDQHSVFEDLVQLDNPQRDRARGHGLGLGIVRRLSRLLGAEVSIDSEPGRGTQVHLDLPPGHETSVVIGQTQGQNPGLVARHLLVLDDDAQVRRAYATALVAMGCKVHVASDVAGALSAFDAHDLEVALVDYRLGGEVDGIAACEQLRARRPGLLAILVSADTGPELRNRAARANLPTLRKPVSDALLASTINRLLSERTAPRAATS